MRTNVPIEDDRHSKASLDEGRDYFNDRTYQDGTILAEVLSDQPVGIDVDPWNRSPPGGGTTDSDGHKLCQIKIFERVEKIAASAHSHR